MATGGKSLHGETASWQYQKAKLVFTALVAAVQASVQTVLPALVEAAAQQHSRASGNSSPSTSPSGLEISGQSYFLSVPSRLSSRQWRWPLAARIKALATHKVCYLWLGSFVSAPGFLGTFNQEGSCTSAVQCLPSTVSSLGAPISSVATLLTNSSALHPILEQPFVVGTAYSAIPYKVVATIVAGKYLNLADLLTSARQRSLSVDSTAPSKLSANYRFSWLD